MTHEFSPPSEGATADDRLRQVVFEALGAASVCWSDLPSGTFESSLAVEIGEALLEEIRQWSTAGRVPISEIRREPKQRVRRNAPDTSWDAALEILSDKARRTYQRIYAALQLSAKTDWELRELFVARGWPHSESSIRARRSELVAAGWIRPTSERRASPSGRPSIVWEAIS